MRCILAILFLSFFLSATAQKKSLFYSAAGSVQKDNDPKELALQLTAPHTSEKEKVAAIFRWITDNISYKVRSYPIRSSRLARYQPEPVDTALEKLSLNEIVAYDVLRKREGVCNGYARLFKTLCDYAGIRSEIITGYARTNMGRPGDRFRSNHTWNAVMIDSAWHLLDVTWASGFISANGNEFIRQYDDYYFLTPPQHFVRDHYPEDLQWTLLADPPALREFHQMPFKLTGFIKYSITAFQPATGFLEAAAGDTLQFALEVSDPVKDRQMAPERSEVPVAADSVAWVFLQPDTTQKGKRVLYTYTVAPGVTHIQLSYNNDVILRYRLHTRKEQE